VICIVDVGLGNVGAVRSMLYRIGAESVTTADPAAIASADRLILPGVGAFDAAVTRLTEHGLVPVLHARVRDAGVPILGICLGMQLLSRRSEEGTLPGLGWIAADTVRFRFSDGERALPVPHMGWNTLTVRRPVGPLKDLDPESRFYFVHSYHVRCDREEDVMATARYGMDFHAAVARDNVFGVQFHPEKSHRFGMSLLRTFAAAGQSDERV